MMQILTAAGLTKALSGSDEPSSDRRGNRPDAAYASLCEGLTSEAQYAASLTAVAASGINTLNSQDAIPATAIAGFATPDLGLLRKLQTMAQHASNNGGEFMALTLFVDSHLSGQYAFEDFAREIYALGGERAAIVHQRSLADIWRNACRRAVLALNELETELAPHLSGLYLQNNQVLLGLLKSAAQGFKPCLDQNGELSLPPLPQQRRWPRLSVLQNCQVTIGGERFDAFVRDVSTGGMGLERTPPVFKGTSLSVEMQTGRKLSGVVVWSREAQAGLKFYRPLLPSDPLIRG